MSLVLQNNLLAKEGLKEFHIKSLSNELDLLLKNDIISSEDADNILRYTCSLYINSLIEKIVSKRINKALFKWMITNE